MTDRDLFRQHLDACPDCYLIETDDGLLSTKFCADGKQLWQEWGRNWFASLAGLELTEDGHVTSVLTVPTAM